MFTKTKLLILAWAPLLFFGFWGVTQAAVITWDGGGGNNYWSNASNWSADTLPTAADDVVFNGTNSKNSNIDAAFTGSVGSISINPGYTGSISMARTLAVTKSAGGSGDVSINAGSWNVGTRSVDVEGNWTKTGGTFSPGSTGTVSFTGTGGTQVVDPGGQNFYKWQHNGTSTLQMNGDLSVTNQFNHTAGVFNLNGKNLTVSGTSNLSGGTLNLSSGTVSLASTLTVNGATLNGDSSDLTINTLSLVSGALTATSGGFYVNGHWVQTGGIFTPGAGTVIFSGTAQNVNIGPGVPFNNLVHNGTGTLSMTGNLDVAGTLVNLAGDFDANTKVLVVNGLASFNAGAYFSSTGSQTFNGGLNINGATWNGSSGLIVVNGDFNANSTVNAPTSFFTVSGDFIISPGVYFPSATGTVRMGGAGPQSLSLNGNSIRNLYNIGTGTVTVIGSDVNVLGIFKNNSGTFDMNGFKMTVAGLATIAGGLYNPGVNLNSFNGGLTNSGGFFSGTSGTVNIVGDLTISWGTFKASSNVTTLSGNLLDTFGTFDANSGDFVLNGVNQSIVGDVTFYNLQKNVLLADTLTFGAGSNIMVAGLTDLRGVAGNLLTIDTDLGGTQVNFDPQGGRMIEYLDVMDNNNINATVADCLVGCVDSGNNLNWAFPQIQFSSATGNISENGGGFDLPITLSHSLATPVTVDYTVNIISTATGGGVDYTLANGTATFNAGALLPTIPVTVLINDDGLIETSETIVVDLSNPTAPAYLGPIKTFVLTIVDNDLAGYDIVPLSGTTTEAGGTQNIQVRLTSEPTAAVTIGVSSSNLSEGTVNVAALTFDNSNWNVYQTIIVTGVDDSLIDGDANYQIVLSADVATLDLDYNGLDPADVTMTNLDNDVPAAPAVSGSGAGGQFVCPAYDASDFQAHLVEKSKLKNTTKLSFSFSVPQDVNLVAISIKPNFSDTSFKSYRAIMDLEIPNGREGQMVYFRFRNVSGCSQDRSWLPKYTSSGDESVIEQVIGVGKPQIEPSRRQRPKKPELVQNKALENLAFLLWFWMN